MATYNLVPTRAHPSGRRETRTACKRDGCGMGGLEWVHLSIDGAPAEWVYVPYGTDDFSGTVHPYRPESDSGVHAGAPAATAPTPSSPSVDLTGINQRIDALDNNAETLRNAINAQSATLDAIAKTAAPKYDDSGVKASLADVFDRVADVAAEVKAIANAAPIRIEIKPVKGAVKAMTGQHRHFANALVMLQAIGQDGVLALTGPAGSRKTSAIKPLADALGIGFEVQSVGMGATKGDIVGFRDAHGVYQESQFFRAFTGIENGTQGKGKLYCGDEYDAIMPQIATLFNAGFANEFYGFPPGMFPRAAENLNIVCMNTMGRGPDSLYNDRQPLGGATLDRFVFLPWDTEWASIAGSVGLNSVKATDGRWFPNPGNPRSANEFADWDSYVYRVNQIVVERDIRASIGGRALRIGAKLLAAGLNTNYQSKDSDGLVEYATIWAHMSDQDADTVKANL